jgi:hypothetical protein
MNQLTGISDDPTGLFTRRGPTPGVSVTTRSSTTEAILRDSVDYSTLFAPKRVTVFGERCLGLRFELLERVGIPTDEDPVDCVVCDIQWKGFDI